MNSSIFEQVQLKPCLAFCRVDLSRETEKWKEYSEEMEQQWPWVVQITLYHITIYLSEGLNVNYSLYLKLVNMKATIIWSSTANIIFQFLPCLKSYMLM